MRSGEMPATRSGPPCQTPPGRRRARVAQSARGGRPRPSRSADGQVEHHHRALVGLAEELPVDVRRGEAEPLLEHRGRRRPGPRSSSGRRRRPGRGSGGGRRPTSRLERSACSWSRTAAQSVQDSALRAGRRMLRRPRRTTSGRRLRHQRSPPTASASASTTAPPVQSRLGTSAIPSRSRRPVIETPP